MGDQVKTVVEAAGIVDSLGVPAIMALLCCWLGYLYLQEKKAREKMTDRLLDEVTSSSQQMSAVMKDVETAVERFRLVLESIKPYLTKK